jgi:hypothetical protein
VQLDATPTNPTLRLWSSGAAANFNVIETYCYECSETFNGVVHPVTKYAVASAVTTYAAGTAALANLTNRVVSSPVYAQTNSEICVTAIVPVSGAGVNIRLAITESVNGGAASVVRDAITRRGAADIGVDNVQLAYVNRNPTPGSTYVYEVQEAHTTTSGGADITIGYTASGYTGLPYLYVHCTPRNG